MFKFGKASETRLATIKPNLQKVARRALELSSQDFQIVQGNRTQAEQNSLYEQGRTKPGKVVTWTRKSNHIGGSALDFAAWVDGKVSWDAKLYPKIGDAFKQASLELGIGINWGGNWRTKDWGHIELNGINPAPGVPSNPRPIPTAPVRTNAEIAMEHFNMLYPRHVASAIVAHGMWESGGHVKHDIFTDAKGDGGTAFGGWQWRLDRREALEKLAAKMLKLPASLTVQLAFVPQELKGTEKRVAEWLKKTTTVEEAVAAFMGYLRPRGYKPPKTLADGSIDWTPAKGGHAYQNRLNLAYKLYQKGTTR
jgi:hypothetical protein